MYIHSQAITTHLSGSQQGVARGVVHHELVEGERDLEHKLIVLLLLAHQQEERVDLWVGRGRAVFSIYFSN